MAENRSNFINSLQQQGKSSFIPGNSKKKSSALQSFTNSLISNQGNSNAINRFSTSGSNSTSARTAQPQSVVPQQQSVIQSRTPQPLQRTNTPSPLQTSKQNFFNTVSQTSAQERQRIDDENRANRDRGNEVTIDRNDQSDKRAEDLRLARENVLGIQKRTAEELQRTRREEDRIRDNEAGALSQGVDSQLNKEARDSARALSDLALAEGVSTNVLNSLIADGESEIEAQIKLEDLATKVIEGGGTQEQINQILGAKDFSSALGFAAQSGLMSEKDSTDGFTLGKDQTRFEFNPATGSFESVGSGVSGSSTSGGFTQTGKVSDLTQGIIDGVAQISDLTPSDRSRVIAELSASGQAPKVGVEKAEKLSELVSKMVTHPGLKSSTGKSSLIPAIPGTEKFEFEKLFDQLKGLLTLENLGLMKGVLSDTDIKILTDAATSLDLGLSEEDFLETLQDVDKSSGTVGTTETGEKYRVLPDGNIEILDFNSVGNTSASVQIPQSSRLAFVNNNPGNLRFAEQQGATSGEGGFARFNSPQAGFEALKRQIRLDAGRGLTLTQFANKFAPPSENDTIKYIKDIASFTGINPNTLISNVDETLLAKAVAKKESSTQIA